MSSFGHGCVGKQLALPARDVELTLADYIITDIIPKLAASESSERQHEGPSIYPRLPNRSHVIIDRNLSHGCDQLPLPTMAFWVNYIIRTALVLEVSGLLATRAGLPPFMPGVSRGSSS